MREDELRQKAHAVKVLVLDVDGVMTDGRAFYGSRGYQGLIFNIRDGAGIKYLRRIGIETALISGRTVDAVMTRAQEIGIEHVVRGAKVKLEAYEELKGRLGFEDGEAAYMGDDLPDLPVMRRVGLAVAVADARPEVREAADMVTEAAGGRGAVREAAEFIIKARGKWDQIMARYRE